MKAVYTEPELESDVEASAPQSKARAPANTKSDALKSLHSPLKSMQRQLTEIAEAAQPLSDIHEEIQERVEETQQLLTELLLRAEQNKVSVLITGTMNAGKSSLINSLLGNVVCPTGDQATTSSILTIESGPGDQYQLLTTQNPSQPQTSEQSLLLQTESAAAVQRKLREFNAAARKDGDNQVPDTDYDLILRVPELVMAHTGNAALELVDSPGSNEALSSYLSEQWAVAVTHSDIVVVVVAYSQLESKDVAEFWTRYANELPSEASSRNLLVFVNKYDQADPNDVFAEEDSKIEDTRRRCVDLVRGYTDSKINLTADQVFVGSARDALLSGIATNLDNDIADEVFEQEYGVISALATRAFGSRRSCQPATAAAMKELVNWQDVHDDSRIDDFVACFGSKAYSAEIAHVYKLVAAVDAAALQMTTSYTSRGNQLEKEIFQQTNEVEKLRVAKEKVDAYFRDVSPDDAIAEDESKRLLLEWISETKDAVVDALDTTSEKLPPTLSATDEELLLNTIVTFEKAALEAIQLTTQSYKPSVAGLTDLRWETVHNSDEEIQQLLGGRLSTVVDKSQYAGVSTSEVDSDSLSLLSEWLINVARLNAEEVTAQIKLTARAESDPGAVYRSEIDLARPVNKRRLSGSFFHDSEHGHIKLGHEKNSLTATFQVDKRFAGHAFVIELSHLASDGGPASRAPVTVLVNDHVVRENFCPRAEHGSENDAIGLWDYVLDRWNLDPAILQSGENKVQILYCSDGTTCYWIQSLCLQCEVLPTSTTVIDTQTVKEFLETSMVTRLQEGLESEEGGSDSTMHDLSLPNSALRDIHKHYDDVLITLQDDKISERAKYKEQETAIATVLSLCKELSAACQSLADEVDIVSPPGQ